MRITLKKRPPLLWWQRALLPLGAVALSILLSSFLIVWAGANPLKAWYLILSGSLGSSFSLLETLVKMAPLAFTGLAVAVAFQAEFWNIGAEGQLYVGALVAAALGVLPLQLPGFLHLPLIIIGGFLGGGLLAALPGYLKASLKVNDVVTTLLINYIVLFLIGALLEGVWRDPVSGWPHSPLISESARFPVLLPRSRFHLGIILAVVTAAVVYLIMKKSVLGYFIRSVGQNIRAAHFGGIRTGRVFVTAAFFSGGLAGLAGVGEVCAVQHFLAADLSTGFGYYGIAVALLGRLHPVGVVLAAFYFAAVITGSEMMSRVTGVPVYLAEVILGITVLSMLIVLLFDKYTIAIERSRSGHRKA